MKVKSNLTERQLRLVSEQLLEALVAALEHLEYCGYGDSWERSCARESKLPQKINQAIFVAQE